MASGQVISVPSDHCWGSSLQRHLGSTALSNRIFSEMHLLQPYLRQVAPEDLQESRQADLTNSQRVPLAHWSLKEILPWKNLHLWPDRLCNSSVLQIHYLLAGEGCYLIESSICNNPVLKSQLPRPKVFLYRLTINVACWDMMGSCTTNIFIEVEFVDRKTHRENAIWRLELSAKLSEAKRDLPPQCLQREQSIATTPILTLPGLQAYSPLVWHSDPRHWGRFCEILYTKRHSLMLLLEDVNEYLLLLLKWSYTQPTQARIQPEKKERQASMALCPVDWLRQGWWDMPGLLGPSWSLRNSGQMAISSVHLWSGQEPNGRSRGNGVFSSDEALLISNALCGGHSCLPWLSQPVLVISGISAHYQCPPLLWPSKWPVCVSLCVCKQLKWMEISEVLLSQSSQPPP